MKPKSIIGKAFVTIDYYGRTDGPDLQHKINEWWDKLVVPAIEMLVNGMDDDILVRIPEMKFDITAMASDNWQEAAKMQIISGLQQEIRSRMETLPGASGTQSVMHRPSAERFIDEWRFFLQKGFIPWWSMSANPYEWKAAITGYLETKATITELSELVDIIVVPAAADRLAAILRGKLLRRFLLILSAWDPVFSNAICDAEQVVNDAQQQGVAQQTAHSFRKELVLAALKRYPRASALAVIRKAVFPDTKTAVAVKQALLKATGKNSSAGSEIRKALDDIFSDRDMAKDTRQDKKLPASKKNITERGTSADNKPGIAGGKFLDELTDARTIWEEIFGKAAVTPEAYEEHITTTAEDVEKDDNAAQRAIETEQRRKLREEVYEAAAEGIYIQNAGIVIVAAYLSVFFADTGVLENEEIVDMPRAVALLHYLACGQEEPEEHEVVLPKILCGIDPSAFVDTGCRLSEADKAAAGQLLEAVIENWTALKHTSPDSLRETFLMREGRLAYEQDAWKLYVQESVYDILVGMIPWNIGMIYLPWMPSILRVSWHEQ